MTDHVSAKPHTYKIAVFVPEKDLTTVKTAMFAAGGGQIGNYEACSWQVLGEGQFRPMTGSSPSVGKQGASGKIG